MQRRRYRGRARTPPRRGWAPCAGRRSRRSSPPRRHPRSRDALPFPRNLPAPARRPAPLAAQTTPLVAGGAPRHDDAVILQRSMAGTTSMLTDAPWMAQAVQALALELRLHHAPTAEHSHRLAGHARVVAEDLRLDPLHATAGGRVAA